MGIYELYIFALSFTVVLLFFILPFSIGIYYQHILRKYGFLSKKRNKHLLDYFKKFPPKTTLRNICLTFCIFSILCSNIIMLGFGFESSYARDLSLFIGLWAATLIGLANFLK